MTPWSHKFTSCNIFTTMNSQIYLLFTATRVLMLLHFLLSPPSCFCHPHSPPSTSLRGLLFEGKTRLGSTPPSCHNKCNQCHPCMAVQVPTIPITTTTTHDPVQPDGMTRTIPMMFFDPARPGNNKYSNYKPLGWKCRCGDHFFNP